MATSRRTKPADLDKAIGNILAEYGDNVTEAIKKAATEVAKKAAKEIKAASPVRTGAYKKDWAYKQSDTRFGREAVVYNRKHYQLTHLLEKGHAKRGGGRVRPIRHIEPVEEKAVKAFRKAVEEIAGEG